MHASKNPGSCPNHTLYSDPPPILKRELLLQLRVLRSLARYFGLLALIFTVMMLIPSANEGIFATPAGVVDQIRKVMEPLPALWLILLPTAFMVTVLLTFSRLSLKGEVRIWRAAGVSVWPFARVIGLAGAVLGLLMTGVFWQYTQPEDDFTRPKMAVTTFQASDGSRWMAAEPVAAVASETQVLLLVSALGDGAVLRTRIVDAPTGNTLRTGPGWLSDGDDLYRFDSLDLTVLEGTVSGDGAWWRSSALAYRAAYPVLLIGLGLLMLPLALSIDGQRLTLVKIVGACLLALNTLFALLMTDAMAQAGLWAGWLFYPLRATGLLALGVLLVLLTEERTA